MCGTCLTFSALRPWGCIEAPLANTRYFTQVVERAAFIVLTAPVRGPFAGPGWGACRFRFRLVRTHYVCLVSCQLHVLCAFVMCYGSQLPLGLELDLHLDCSSRFTHATSMHVVPFPRKSPK